MFRVMNQPQMVDMEDNRVHGLVQAYLLDKYGRRSCCPNGARTKV